MSKGNVLGFHGGERDGGLLLAAPADDGVAELEDVSGDGASVDVRLTPVGVAVAVEGGVGTAQGEGVADGALEVQATL